MEQNVYQNIELDELIALAEQEEGEICLLDVREHDEYRAIRSSLSQLVPLSQLSKGEGLDTIRAVDGQAVYVICRSGKRSIAACEILHDAGFTRLFNVVGGMEAWRQRRLPFLEMD